MSRSLLRIARRALQLRREQRAAARRDSAKAPGFLDELMKVPPELRKELASRVSDFASPSLGQLLLDRAEASFASAPGEAAKLVGLALAIGQQLAARLGVGPAAEGLLGRARSLEGEAQRRRGDFFEARQTHRQACTHLEALPLGGAERADYCRYLARLRRDEGLDDEAIALMARALERFESLAERRREQECRLELAWMHLDDQETDSAVGLFEEVTQKEAYARRAKVERHRPRASGLLEPEGRELAGEEGGLEGVEEPWATRAAESWLSARHGLALAWADLGRDAKARAQLAEIVDGAADQGVETLRLKRVEASVRQRLGENEEAAELLFAAWSGYALAGAPYEAVPALLDLAALRIEEGSAEDLERLRQGLEILPGLEESLRERVRAGLAQAAQRGGIEAIEQLEVLKHIVEWARCDPEARWHPLRGGREEESSPGESAASEPPAEEGEGA